MENTCYPFSEAAKYFSKQYTFQYCLGLALSILSYGEFNSFCWELGLYLADFAITTFLLIFLARIFIFLTSCHS